MATVLRTKRRWTGVAGAPATLASGELAYNGLDDILYIGFGDDGGGTATSVKVVGGLGTYALYAPLLSPGFTGVPTAPTAAGGTSTTQLATTAFVQAAVTAGSVADGDKGDIVVTGSGSAWTIDAGAVTLAKMANVVTASFLGRNTAGTGAVEAMTVGQVKTLLNLTGTNSGDQTITLSGDITGTGTGAFATTLGANVVTYGKLQTVATGTLIGSIAAGTATPGAVTMGVSLALSSTGVLSRAALTGHVTAPANSNATTIAAGVITNAMQVAAPANTLSGNNTGIAATPLDLTVTQVKTMLSLSNVDNTSDANKPVSTAQATALALKAPLASPTLTGVPTAPTAAAGNNTTQISTTAFVTAAVAALIDGAPGAIDTLNELAAALGDDPNFSTTITNSIAAKLAIANNLSDVANVVTARSNLGLGSMALQAATAVAITGGTIDGVILDGGTF